MSHTQRWQPICPKLRRVQEKARANPEEQFTSLAHHLTVERLRNAYRRIEADTAPGVDGVSKKEYGKNLEKNRNLKRQNQKLLQRNQSLKPLKKGKKRVSIDSVSLNTLSL